MGAGSSMVNMIGRIGPAFGVTGGMAALAMIPHAETRLFTCAVMLALAAGSAIRRCFFVAPATRELSDYPFDTRVANPWDRDGGPHGL